MYWSPWFKIFLCFCFPYIILFVDNLRSIYVYVLKFPCFWLYVILKLCRIMLLMHANLTVLISVQISYLRCLLHCVTLCMFCDLHQSYDMAAGLLATGLQPGDRVGIWSPNCYEWFVTQFAAARAGLVLVSNESNELLCLEIMVVSLLLCTVLQAFHWQLWKSNW